MTRKAVVRRREAQRDVEQAADHYFAEGGTALELRFIDALQAAVTRIATNPGVGSPRYAAALSMPGLRFWKLTKFPYLIFYVEREDQVDIWRVLHEQRDIPQRFGPEPGAT
ncbi:MAG: plasmid stabilization protein [Ramlibacter sp.]|nr:plasmid stabilization protein [Ramlibacter sp.]